MDSRRRRTKTKLLIALLIPALLVWVAPLLLPHTALWNSVVDRALTGQIRGKVRCGRVSLGWLSPVRLYDVRWLDDDGQTVATVGSVATSRSLIGLALQPANLGEITIANPQARVSLRADGSNLEDLLISQPETPPTASAPPNLTLSIVDGRVDIEDLTTQQNWRTDHLHAQWSSHATGPATARWRAELARLHDPAGDQPANTPVPLSQPDQESQIGVGQLEGHFSWNLPTASNNTTASPAAPATANPGPPGSGELELHAKNLPLGWATPLLRRWVGPLAIAGELTVDGKLQWSSNSQQLDLKQLTTQNLALHAPTYLGSEPLQLSQLHLLGGAQLQGDRCELRGLELQTDVAHLQADGAFSLAAFRGEAMQNALVDLMQSEDYRLEGSLDLAQLAKLAPELLHVRPGTEIIAGKIAWQLTSTADGPARRWHGKVESSDLEAEAAGRRVSWQQPLQATFAAHQSSPSTTPTSLVLDQLICQSTFLQAEARGQLNQGQVTVKGDLGKLAEELDRFFDLQALQLAGTLHGDVTWQAAGPGSDTAQPLAAGGNLKLNQLTVALGPDHSIQEPSLTLQVTTNATLTSQGLQQLDAAQLQIQAGQDELQVDLVEPIREPLKNHRWPITGRIAGDLNRWLSRGRLFISTGGWDVGGQGVITFAGEISPDEVAIKKAKADVNDLQVVSDWLSLREPRVQLESDLRWQQAERHLTADSFTFASSALAFRADKVDVALAAQQPSAAATIGFRTDLTRLAYWFQDPRQPWDWSLAGKAVGQIKISQQQGITSGRWSIDCEQLAYHHSVPDEAALAAPTPGRAPANANRVPPMKLVWLEPTMRLTGQGDFDPTRDRLQLSAFEIICDALKLSAAGEVGGLTQDSQVALQGEIAYDLAEVTRRLQPQLGENISMEGKETRPFQLRGPLRQISLTQVSENTTGSPGRLASSNTLNNSVTNNSDPNNTTAAASAAPAATPWPPTNLAGQASVGWSGAAVYGIPFGPGQIEASLNQGVVAIKPLDVALSEGRLRLEPQLLLHEPRPTVVVQAGRLLDQVRIAPEMCASWLKYVMPMVADVAEAEGKFSTDLIKPAIVPLDDPTSGHLQGNLAVHSIQVGPGPLARELLQVAQLAKVIGEGRPASAATAGSGETNAGPIWLRLPAQDIPFHLRERRVYHERLVVKLKDVEMVTSGSVGLDNSLEMVAEIPIRDEWVSKNRYLASLQGQKLRLPIGGTLSAPRVDQRVLQQLTTQTITNAAGKVIENELNRGLDRLIRPKGNSTAPGGGNQPGAGSSNAPSPGTLPGNFPIPNIPLPPGIRPR